MDLANKTGIKGEKMISNWLFMWDETVVEKKRKKSWRNCKVDNNICNYLTRAVCGNLWCSPELDCHSLVETTTQTCCSDHIECAFVVTNVYGKKGMFS